MCPLILYKSVQIFLIYNSVFVTWFVDTNNGSSTHDEANEASIHNGMKILPTENIKPGEHMFKKRQRFLMLLELESSGIVTTNQKYDITTFIVKQQAIAQTDWICCLVCVQSWLNKYWDFGISGWEI